MIVPKEQFSVCQKKLNRNNGLAHNHYGGWFGFNDFDYKAISHLLEDGTIETRVTLFLDEDKKIPAFFIIHFSPSFDDIAVPELRTKSPELLDDTKLMRIGVDALTTQMKRLDRPGGRIPAGARALVMFKKARGDGQRKNVREAGSRLLNVFHDEFVDLMIQKDMGISKYTGTGKKKAS